MKQKFSFDGATYSKNKDSFKGILRKYGLRWKGSMGDFVWIGENDKIIAEFERDSERDITISATLVWNGRKKTDFLRELEEWATDVGGKKETTSGKKGTMSKNVQKELEFWDSLNKPDEARLRAEGRPDSWIEKDMKEWRRSKRQKKKELMERYG